MQHLQELGKVIGETKGEFDKEHITHDKQKVVEDYYDTIFWCRCNNPDPWPKQGTKDARNG